MRARRDPAGGTLPAHRPVAPTAAAVIVVALLVAGCAASPSPSASPTVEPTATPVASATPVAKAPAATVDELLSRLYAALSGDDSAAFRALASPGAVHYVYYRNSSSGREVTSFSLEGYDPATDEMSVVTPAGDPLVVGDVVAVPVKYTYPGETDTGIDLLKVVHVSGGLLLGDGATIYEVTGLTLDATAMDVIRAEVAAWNDGKVDGVMATMADDAVLWDGLGAATRVVYTGTKLHDFVAGSVWFDVEIPGDPITSGPFVAVPNRLTSEGGSTALGISVFEIRDGKIALQIYEEGA